MPAGSSYRERAEGLRLPSVPSQHGLADGFEESGELDTAALDSILDRLDLVELEDRRGQRAEHDERIGCGVERPGVAELLGKVDQGEPALLHLDTDEERFRPGWKSAREPCCTLLGARPGEELLDRVAHSVRAGIDAGRVAHDGARIRRRWLAGEMDQDL